MKRSLLVLAASSVFVLGACAAEEEPVVDEMPVEEIAPAPAPAPMDTMPMDTTMIDTLTTTTGQ